MPLGLLLVNRGAISVKQLHEALALQRNSGVGRIGEWFCEMGAVSEEVLTAALAQQWGCPVFPLDHVGADLTVAGLLPLPLLEAARSVPAHVSDDGKSLHLVFGERLDHTLLYAAEKMLNCRTFACIAPERIISESLDRLRHQADRSGPCFETVREPDQTTLIISNYAIELRATALVLARAAAHIWVRFYRGTATRDLLFRVLPENNSVPAPQRRAPVKVLSGFADIKKNGVINATGPL
jgi:hypothetical protein